MLGKCASAREIEYVFGVRGERVRVYVGSGGDPFEVKVMPVCDGFRESSRVYL
jgi:hypothetical protein